MTFYDSLSSIQRSEVNPLKLASANIFAMNHEHENLMSKKPDLDVLIMGAGLSGIDAACHLEMNCPNKTYQVLERRADLGGTWDLFKYPGIRSDSDMSTFGFSFRPWNGD